MILGDSFSAGYGIQPQQGWVSLLAKTFRTNSIRNNIKWSMQVSVVKPPVALWRVCLNCCRPISPDVVVIELGGNDGLRGQPPQMIQKNLAKLIAAKSKSQSQSGDFWE